MKKKILLAGLVVVTVACGFFREHIFVAINRDIDQGNDASGHLLLLKWVLTGVFCLVFLFLTILLLHFAFEKKKYTLLALFSYAILLGIAGILGGMGVLFFKWESVYPFVRGILGIAQSPIVAMVLLAVAFIDKRAVQESDFRGKTGKN